MFISEVILLLQQRGDLREKFLRGVGFINDRVRGPVAKVLPVAGTGVVDNDGNFAATLRGDFIDEIQHVHVWQHRLDHNRIKSF